MDFEEKFGPLFPEAWEVSERICIEFCNITRYKPYVSCIFLFHELSQGIIVKYESVHPRNLTLKKYLIRSELSRMMGRRTHEIDVKLLLFAIQRTTNFEALIAKRFTGATLNEKQARN